jgi:bifunctional oligoribonuclease and PAP phosphatase NrnA
MSFTSSAPAEQIQRLKHMLEGVQQVAIVAHHNPDGDALGSSLGLAHVLRATGLEVTVVMPNMPAQYLLWMPGADGTVAFESERERVVDLLAKVDLLFCLDFNRADRVRDLEQPIRGAKRIVVIDHHQEPEDFAHLLFSDVTASSTCQMVYDVLVALGHGALISTEAATCLYTGMVTDSGSFRFRSTSAHTMRVAADLMERGVRIDEVHTALSDDNTVHRLKLLGFTLDQRMQVLEDLSTVVLWLDRADLERFQYKPGDTEGIVNYGLSIGGIRIAAFFMERADGIKLSVRSKGALPVNELMKDHFEGGGHINAAGGQTQESMPQAIERFTRLLPEFLRAHT